MGAAVEDVAAALVREYLSRKGLHKTRTCIDEELPRTDSSINNRKALRQILHLEALYKKNKLEEFPLKSMLEMVVKRHMEEHGDVSIRSCSVQQAFLKQTSILTNSDNVLSHGNMVDDRDGGRGASAKGEEWKWFVSAFFHACLGVHSELDSHLTLTKHLRSSEALALPTVPSHHKSLDSNSIFPSKKMFLSQKSEMKTQLNAIRSPSCSSDSESIIRQVPVAPEKDCSSCRAAEKNSTDIHKNRGSRAIRGMMAGPVSSSMQECNKKRVTRKLCGSGPVQAKDEENKHDFAARSAQSHSAEARRHTAKVTSRPDTNDNEIVELLKPINKNEEISERSPGNEHQTQNREILPNSLAAGDLHPGDMILDDISDDEKVYDLSSGPIISRCTSLNVSSHPINHKTAIALKEVLFGSPLSCFSDEWKTQSFTFSDTPQVRYGIIQKKGGPCGVLASVQACVLQKLLFEDTSSASEHERLQPSRTLRRRCLLTSLVEILWRAGGNKRAAVAVSSGRKHFTPVGRYKVDGVLETITIFNVENLEDLKLLLDQHIKQFESGPFGCILLIVSAILSRSVERVKSDFDVPTNSLIGAHGYCTQELVNLLLVGQAVSNVFNDDFELSSGDGSKTVLKGIKERSDIGFLSLFEHYDICKVGTYLKNPRFPIWVVCSESHFTVLFCTSKELSKDWMVAKKFDLYYYDGLANQLEEIRLTISTGSSRSISKSVDKDLIPPLELCIRTKWRDALVSWNKTEPIL
ncbi:probable ubiquitin carboxyl-terminal hydrolase MINDY-4 isoform X1 [Scleropages formosus]|uniref:Ubiquitin carboxyl-terminal hydrolase MINDY n=2 Tax=Scleropages formosus TaxID=113540 RepID=A0A8C9W3I2_SCLFO|nr:probable ubiquitin carboxyl-terminal hydrolase MINDY-4 isoform X1 [Scleropages formosus]